VLKKRQVQRNLTITRFELAKRILVLLGLAGFMLLCLMVIRSNPRTGWAGVALFGVMTVLAAVDLIRLRNHKIGKGDGARKNVRATLIWIGTMIVSIFFGVAGTLLSNLANFRRPVIAIWLATFVATLAFYPFRGEEEKELPTFPLWAVYCAVMGFVSVGFLYPERLLD
jgi:multisubunit Na+/H+ antiporter MnhB subunit